MRTPPARSHCWLSELSSAPAAPCQPPIRTTSNALSGIDGRHHHLQMRNDSSYQPGSSVECTTVYLSSPLQQSQSWCCQVCGQQLLALQPACLCSPTGLAFCVAAGIALPGRGTRERRKILKVAVYLGSAAGLGDFIILGA